VSGHWRDPLVARDILLGLTMGVCITVSLEAAELLAHGSLGGTGPIWPLDGFRFALTVLFDETSRAFQAGLSLFVLLFLLTVLVRRQWIAFALLVVLTGLQNTAVSQDPVIGGVAFLIVSAAILLALWRFGLLVPIGALMAANVVTRLPMTFDLSRWFAPASCVGMALLVALAVFGAWTSANLRTVLPKVLGES